MTTLLILVRLFFGTECFLPVEGCRVYTQPTQIVEVSR